MTDVLLLVVAFFCIYFFAVVVVSFYTGLTDGLGDEWMPLEGMAEKIKAAGYKVGRKMKKPDKVCTTCAHYGSDVCRICGNKICYVKGDTK